MHMHHTYMHTYIYAYKYIAYTQTHMSYVIRHMYIYTRGYESQPIYNLSQPNYDWVIND